MAFDAFRSQKRAPSRRRQLTVALSIAVHGAAIAAGVAYSFWHVEELTPPTLRVTFLAAAPPPPPPPPPAGGGGRARPKPQIKPRPVVQPKTPEIVQPREVKKEEPKEEPKVEKDDGPKGEPGGVKGGVAGGTPGGTVGGTAGGKPGGVLGGTPGGQGVAPRKILAGNLGRLQRVGCAEPPFPPSLRRVGVTYMSIAKICVAPNGVVESVAIMKKSEPQLDDGIVNSMKTCHHQPLLAGSLAVPYCYIQPFEFKPQ